MAPAQSSGTGASRSGSAILANVRDRSKSDVVDLRAIAKMIQHNENLPMGSDYRTLRNCAKRIHFGIFGDVRASPCHCLLEVCECFRYLGDDAYYVALIWRHG